MRRLSWAVTSACLLALAVPALGGCQRAARYPPKKDSPDGARADAPPKRPQLDPELAWRFSEAAPSQIDVPLEFVHAGTDPAGWAELREFWNPQWGAATAHLGLDPLRSLLALAAAADRAAVKLKVPLGLPDPTANIPAANRPTYLQWRLGKKLFFDRDLLPGPSPNVGLGCISCHVPVKGFTTERDLADQGLYNPPTLINSVYNRHQFWDGRATHLEEVLQRTLDDEAAPLPRERPEVRHAWPGVVRSLRERKDTDYAREFQRVYGGPPTQANVGRALAAYMRTILSGNSVYDRAEAERARAGAKELALAHFEAALDSTTLKALQSGGNAQETARELARGHELFRGRARCAACHPAPLFTDHDFHNIGVGDSDFVRQTWAGQELGRVAALPAGLRDPRYLGAFRTPTLRALPRTAPYMHAANDSYHTLDDVLAYFNKDIRDRVINVRFLDPALRDGRDTPRTLRLDAGDLRALGLFLKCLDGDPVPRLVIDPPPK